MEEFSRGSTAPCQRSMRRSFARIGANESCRSYPIFCGADILADWQI